MSTGTRSWWSLSEANRQLVRKFHKEERDCARGDFWYSEDDRDPHEELWLRCGDSERAAFEEAMGLDEREG